MLDSLDDLTRSGENAVITPAVETDGANLVCADCSALVHRRSRIRFRGRASEGSIAGAGEARALSFVAHVTAVLPLVIAIDDLHWADASTVEVLAYLLSRPNLKRVLLACAYRQTEMSLSAHPFVSVRHELVKRRLLVDLPLRRFNREETAHYLDAAFPDNRFPKDLAEVVQARSNGNPFFLSEIARDLIQRGAARRHNDQWHIEWSLEQVRHSLPVSIQSVIERNIQQLDADDRLLMMAASLQGMAFDSRLAAIAAGCRVSDAEQRFTRLESVHSLITLLGESDPVGALPGQRYAFVHVLYQEAFNAAVTPARRAEWSRLIANGLADLYKDDPSRVAAHWPSITRPQENSNVPRTGFSRPPGMRPECRQL